ncbi:membrane associated rhomboid family serine protease [Pontibacter aydingkolensis]|uniref:Rhomboid family intramembrane serine protease n=1 Tax=Pontibacter aydingkolensis TaxID=1911536 RepID=A0ABS7CSJ9_9BACT|nr:rhomboid family intramembrane serine protease [Pontibacter aydingkolensis]MBW7466770.1 rhomboid family intramembrane serine protease [Pontibacter aydingkolensis]
MDQTLAGKGFYTSENENAQFAYSFLPGTLFVALLCLISLLSYLTDADLAWLGVRPRSFFGLIGIVTSPLIHGDLLHLLSNSFPLVLLSGFILYLHRKVAVKVIVLVYILSGILTWFIGRPSFHIGASGVVYGLAGFLLFNGFLRQNRSAMAVSMAILFLYSGLFYGLLPTEERISWEGHLAGFVAGLVAALVYGEGIKKTVPTYIEPGIVQRHVSNTIGPHYRHMHINYQVPQPTTEKNHFYTLNTTTGRATALTNAVVVTSYKKRTD